MNWRLLHPVSLLGVVLLAAALVGSSVAVSPDAGAGYAGPMPEVHRAAAGMEPVDRQGLAEALDAGAAMLGSDAAGLVSTTAQAQRFARGVLGFGYTSFAVKKYPAVASAIEAELVKATGSDDVRITPELRSRIVGAIKESAAAVR